MSTAALPYEINLFGPPSRLQPRIPPWVLSAISLVICVPTGVAEGILFVNVSPTSLPVDVLLGLSITVVEIYAFWYLTLRLTGGGITPLVPFILAPFVVLRFRRTTEGGRRADREEIAAHRRLRRGAITRHEYERIIAYRHFVHNEISQSEYHAILSFLDYHPPSAGTRAHS